MPHYGLQTKSSSCLLASLILPASTSSEKFSDEVDAGKKKKITSLIVRLIRFVKSFFLYWLTCYSYLYIITPVNPSSPPSENLNDICKPAVTALSSSCSWYDSNDVSWGHGCHKLVNDCFWSMLLGFWILGTGQSQFRNYSRIAFFFFKKKTQTLCINLTWTLSQGELGFGGGEEIENFILVVRLLDCKAESTRSLSRYDERVNHRCQGQELASDIDRPNLDNNSSWALEHRLGIRGPVYLSLPSYDRKEMCRLRLAEASRSMVMATMPSLQPTVVGGTGSSILQGNLRKSWLIYCAEK